MEGIYDKEHVVSGLQHFLNDVPIKEINEIVAEVLNRRKETKEREKVLSGVQFFLKDVPIEKVDDILNEALDRIGPEFGFYNEIQKEMHRQMQIIKNCFISDLIPEKLWARFQKVEDFLLSEKIKGNKNLLFAPVIPMQYVSLYSQARMICYDGDKLLMPGDNRLEPELIKREIDVPNEPYFLICDSLDNMQALTLSLGIEKTLNIIKKKGYTPIVEIEAVSLIKFHNAINWGNVLVLGSHFNETKERQLPVSIEKDGSEIILTFARMPIPSKNQYFSPWAVARI
jgi:hypothetical protein